MNRRVLTGVACACALAGVLIGCGPKEPPLRKVDGRTVLMDANDPAPPAAQEAARKKKPKQDDLIIRADDARVGKEAAGAAAAQMGLLGDPELDAYVSEIGKRLLRGVPRRSFQYEFRVIEQFPPNAFALPGGYIFISRGLLALANNEDELANVIGHEIIHVRNRHAARQQAADRYRSPLMIGWLRMKDQAAYGRDMEREADEGGQMLAAAAGYDPAAMSTFQSSLGQFTTLLTGAAQYQSFFDTHPGTSERVANTAFRASEIRWQRDPALGDTRARFLERIDGLPVGDMPRSGVFEGPRFLHPELDFQLRFPDGWRVSNSPQAVGASEPRGRAVIFLGAAVPQDPKAAAQEWVEKSEASLGKKLEVRSARPIKMGREDAYRIETYSSSGMGGTVATVTFFNYGGVGMALTALSRNDFADKVSGRYRSTARSFRPLSAEQKQGFTSRSLHVVEARPGESLRELVQRTGSVWNASQVSVANALSGTHTFSGGERVKIAREQRYRPGGS